LAPVFCLDAGGFWCDRPILLDSARLSSRLGVLESLFEFFYYIDWLVLGIVALASLSIELPGWNLAVACKSVSISSSIGWLSVFSTDVFYSSAVVVSAFCLDDCLEDSGLEGGQL